MRGEGEGECIIVTTIAATRREGFVYVCLWQEAEWSTVAVVGCGTVSSHSP